MFSTGPYKYNRFNLLEKKAAKDYDGDGKVESGKEEYFGSRDKAIKKAMGNCKDGKCGKCEKCQEKKEEFTSVVKELVAEGVDFSEYTWDGLYEGYISEGLPPALLKAIMKKKMGKDKKKEVNENRFAAYGGKDTDAGAKFAKPSKGGDKKGVYTLKGKDGKPLFKEESLEEGSCGKSGKKSKKYTKEDIGQYLMDNGFANNPVSAEIMAEHMSQEWAEKIAEEI